MATYQELRTRSQQVRDEQNIGGNTALRVGQLLMDIVKYFNDNDAAASEYLQQHFAMVNDGTQLLNWQQSPIVILHTMGETYDEGDFSSLSQGENYYRAGFIMEANGQGGGINGETPKANVLYVNLANDTLYTWNGASFDAITSGGGGSISGDDIIKNAYYSNGNLVLIVETESGDKTVTIPVNFDAQNYVPTSRTVNGKALSNNITLSQSDIPGLVAALAALVPQTRTINGKALSSNVTIGMNDIQGLVEAIANAGSGAVSVTTNQDGTFVIHVGSTDYTINLNHTHENMAKIVKCTEATRPQTLADDTIYVQVDSANPPTEIEKLYLFGLEFAGGGVPSTEPKIVSPIGTQIDFNGASTKTVTVRATNLSEALTIAVTGMTASLQTISASDAENGVQLTLTKGQNFVSGTLRIYSSEVDKSWTVIESQAYQPIVAVKLTGTQWLQTDYYPNADTQIEMTCMFVSNSNTGASGYKGLTFLYAKTDSGKFYRMYHTANGDGLIHVPQTGTAILSVTAANLGTPNSVINIDNVAGSFSFAPGGSNPSSKTFTKRTATSPYALEIGRGTYDSSAAPDTTLYGAYDLVIYSLVIKDAGTVVRNYQPKSWNGVPGLYDTVNNNFISSETSDELVAIQNS